MSVKPQHIDDLIRLFGAGAFAEVERKARALLLREKSNGVAWEFLGLALMAQGKPADALPALEKAVQRMPADAQFHDNLGLCRRELKAFDQAVLSFREALKLRPGDPRLLDSLGTSLRAAGRAVEAVEVLTAAVGASPGRAEVVYNLGNALEDLGNADEAEACYRRAIAADPRLARAHNNLGTLLMRKGDLAGAEAALGQAVMLDPQRAEVHENLGILLSRLDRAADARQCFANAVAIEPGRASAYSHLVELLLREDDVGTAMAYLRQAIAADSARVEFTVTLANLLLLRGRELEAEEIVRQALSVAPAAADLLALLGSIRCARKEDDGLGYLLAAFDRDPTPLRALMVATEARSRFDWQTLAKVQPLVQAFVRSPTAGFTPFQLLYEDVTPEQFLQASRVHAATLPTPAVMTHGIRTDRVRVGLLSADLCSHPVGIAIAGVLEALGTSDFDLVLFEPVEPPPPGDPYRQRLESALRQVVPLAKLNDPKAAEAIAAAGPEVLVDLHGWTRYSRAAILARRPAPVQAQWLGYAATMGVDWVDYVLVDHVVAPPGSEAWFSEKLVRLPGCLLPNDPARLASPPPARADLGLPEHGVVFCSFNQAVKVTPEVFACWMRLLGAVAGSVLWQRDPGAAVAAAMRREAEAAGIDPARLVFSPFAPNHADHFGRIGVADIALDTFPYTSHVTGGDALWAGVPLVALAGDSFVTRISGSQLHAAGLPELMTTSLADYEALALALARDPARRTALRARLMAARAAAPLFDCRAFADKLSQAFHAMAERHRRGLPPDHIDVAVHR